MREQGSPRVLPTQARHTAGSEEGTGAAAPVRARACGTCDAEGRRSGFRRARCGQPIVRCERNRTGRLDQQRGPVQAARPGQHQRLQRQPRTEAAAAVYDAAEVGEQNMKHSAIAGLLIANK
jgi:hypothetical protein